MKQRICVSIGKKSFDESLKTARSVANRADVIEIRLDLMEDPAVSPFFEEITVPLLFTNRANWEGGQFSGEERDRIEPLLEAVGHEASYVDLELKSSDSSWTTLRGAIEGTDTKLIGSWTDVDETPSSDVLLSKLQQLYESGAHIGKIMTMAHDYLDVLRVLSLQEKAAQLEFPLIAFCMGEEGIMSRVATAALGGYMTYCGPDDGEAIVPGQVMLFAMHTIYRLLGR